MQFVFTRFYALFLLLTSTLALTACGGGGGDSATDDVNDVSSSSTDEVGRHVYLRYNYPYNENYSYVFFNNSTSYVRVAANCSELRFVEDNDGEIYSEDDNAGNTATVTVTNGEVNTNIVGTTELQSAGFGHCPQGIPGNGTTFASDIRCYDDNEILYLKADQDQFADGETACTSTEGVAGSLEP
ncbi:MAG TPA: hypothetical protein VIQ81_10820 [Gammaproteobacteria bacterium]